MVNGNGGKDGNDVPKNVMVMMMVVKMVKSSQPHSFVRSGAQSGQTGLL